MKIAASFGYALRGRDIMVKSTARVRGTAKRILALLFVAALFLMCFAGCKKEEPAPEKELLVINPADYGEVTVKIATVAKSEAGREIMEKIAEKYEYDFPNVSVEYIHAEDEKAIGEMVRAGITVDAVEVSGDVQLRDFVKNEYIIDITDYYASWTEGFSLTAAAKSAMTTVEKVPYIFPSAIYQEALYYREDKILELELDPPRHWHSLLSSALELKEQENGAEYDLVVADNAADFNLVDTILWSQIGFDKIDKPQAAYFLYANPEKSESEGCTIFGTEEASAALDLYLEMNEKLEISSFDGDSKAAIEAFINGEANFLLAGPEAVKLCMDSMEGSQWNCVPYPIGESSSSAIINDFTGYAIMYDSSNKDIAAHFVRYLCSSDNNSYLARECSFVPVHSDAIQLDKYFSDSKFWAFSSMAKRTTAYRFGNQPKMYEAYEGYEELANGLYADLLGNRITKEDVLVKLDEYWSAAFEAEGKLW